MKFELKAPTKRKPVGIPFEEMLMKPGVYHTVEPGGTGNDLRIVTLAPGITLYVNVPAGIANPLSVTSHDLWKRYSYYETGESYVLSPD